MLMVMTDRPFGMVYSDLDVKKIGEAEQVKCFDPWIIARSQPNRETKARESLMRDGFECWFPAGRRISNKPQRFISSKTRHKKRHVLIEALAMPYPGYLFVRRLTSHRSLWRLWELTGVLGVCAFGEAFATIEDYRIEMMRIHEDAGEYDRWELKKGLSASEMALAQFEPTQAAKERWSGKQRVIGRVDTNQRQSLHLVEEFGRITRIVAATGNIALRAA